MLQTGGVMPELRDTASWREDFERFVAVDGDRLLHAAYGMCGDWQHAEDLVQNALVKIAQRWSHLDDPLAYAYRCLTRATIDRWRALRRRPELLTEPARLPEPAESADPVAEHADLVAALLTLPPRMRAIVVLRYLHDRSEAQTAEILGITTGAVKSGTSRALAKLRLAATIEERI
jgi:RNA polymerase sigma-70 factor (sigma-E family)